MSGTPFSSARLVLGALCATLIAGGPVACETVTTAPPDSQLTGTWRLDKSASDDPDAKVAKVFAAAQSKLRHSLSRYNYPKAGVAIRRPRPAIPPRTLRTIASIPRVIVTAGPGAWDRIFAACACGCARRWLRRPRDSRPC